MVLHPDRHISGLSDSKTVPAAEREVLYQQITARAIAWAVAEASPTEIDTINIHQASLQAMQRAVMALVPLPDLVLVDAFRIPDLLMAQRGVVHGDQRCSAIAAASIVAKVTRDRGCGSCTSGTHVTVLIGTKAMPRRLTCPPSSPLRTIPPCTAVRSSPCGSVARI